tara:strand:+ start:218 stop:637 length:420 start_codon:yes stop_codon:yes gene_type:complete
MTFEVPEEIESLITAFVTRQKRIQSRADEWAVRSREAHVVDEIYKRRLSIDGRTHYSTDDARSIKWCKANYEEIDAQFEYDCAVFNTHFAADELLLELEKFTISNPGDAKSLREAIGDALKLLESLPNPLPEVVKEPIE